MYENVDMAGAIRNSKNALAKEAKGIECNVQSVQIHTRTYTHMHAMPLIKCQSQSQRDTLQPHPQAVFVFASAPYLISSGHV